MYDLRHYDLPCEGTTDRLYYEMPRLGQPRYRGTFRDKPFPVAPHYPGEDPHGKPIGYFGRVYYEQGPPRFKYDGPKKDELYWLERSPYLPSFPRAASANVGPPNERDDSMRDINAAVGKQIETRCSSSRNSQARPLCAPVPTPPSGSPGTRGTGPLRSTGTRSFQPVYQPGENSQSVYTTSFTNPAKRRTLDGVGYL